MSHVQGIHIEQSRAFASTESIVQGLPWIGESFCRPMATALENDGERDPKRHVRRRERLPGPIRNFFELMEKLSAECVYQEGVVSCTDMPY